MATASASHPGRTYTREDLIAQTIVALQTVPADVTEEEVARIVDRLEHRSGFYDEEAFKRAIAESLHLWSTKDYQTGMLHSLQLNQERMMKVEDNLAKDIKELQDLKSNVEAIVMEQMSALEEKIMSTLEAKIMSTLAKGGPQAARGEGYSAQQEELQDLKSNVEAMVMERMSALEEKIMSTLEAKSMSTLAKGQGPQTAGYSAPQEDRTEAILQKLAAKVEEIEKEFLNMPKAAPAEKATEAVQGDGGSQPQDAEKSSEEQRLKKEKKQRDDKELGHLTTYDEALKELQTRDPERNDLSKFEELSEKVKANHDVLPIIKKLIPGLYSAALEQRLGASVKVNFQPFMKDQDELYAFHIDKKPLFDQLVHDVASKTKGEALIPPMKGRPRCTAKAMFKYIDETGIAWHRCTDIIRATILYNDIAAMYSGLELLEKLDQEKKIEIVEFNDRYRSPMPGNYRDLQLSVRIKGMVAELQLNTKAMAYVKENAGHRNFEVARELVAAVKDSDASRCSEILSWGKEQLGEAAIQEILNEEQKPKPVLHEAAGRGNADLVSVFLNYRADVNLKSSNGQSALHKAMSGGHERTAWALLCAGAGFNTDSEGMTPLIEGLLKLRVNPDKEAIARSVSTLAQVMEQQGNVDEFEKLTERLEEFVRKRLKQSSDLVTACKDGNLEKLDGLLRDWCDPSSSAEGLPAVHAALHGGCMDFSAERIPLLLKLLESRANVDATTKTSAGEVRTALEVALKSFHPKAHLGVAALIKQGASLMNRCVRDFLPPWTPKEIQDAKPRDLVQRFVTTWQPLCNRDVLDVDQSLLLKGSALELLLFRGYQAIKRSVDDEESQSKAASDVANMLQVQGHEFESDVVLAECKFAPKEFAVINTVETSHFIKCMASHGQFLAVAMGSTEVLIYDASQEFAVVMTLTESTSDVLSVAWSTAFLAAGDRSGKVRIYDSAQDWVMTKTLEDASGDICALAWSGQLLATGGEDQKVRIYNCAQDFALSATLQDASDYIRCVAWAGQLLAAAGDDKKVRIYDQECSLLHTLSEASNWVFSIAWSPELQLLAAGSKDNKVRVYDATQDFGLVKALKEASNGIEAVAFLGRLIAAGGKDWKVRIYHCSKDFQLVQTLDQASDWIRAIARHGNHFATGADDKKIRIYRVLEDQRPLCSDEQLEHWVQLATAKDHRELDVVLHAAISREALQDFTGAGSIQQAAHTVAAKLRSCGELETAEGILRTYAVKDYPVMKTLQDASSDVRCIAFGEQLVATAGVDGKVRVYDLSKDGVLVKSLEEASGTVYSIAFCQDLLAAPGADGKVRIYDSAQDLLHTLEDTSHVVVSISWSQQQQLLAVGGHDCKVRVYDASQEWCPVKILEEASKKILCISWSAQLLATAGDDKLVRLYDTSQDFQLLKILEHASQHIRSISWSENQLLAAGGGDSKVRIYDFSKEFGLIKTLEDASNWIRSISWLSHLLITGGYDSIVRIYDASQDFIVLKILQMPDKVHSIAYNEEFLAVASGKSVYLHEWAAVQFDDFNLERLWDFAQLRDEEPADASPTSPARSAK